MAMEKLLEQLEDGKLIKDKQFVVQQMMNERTKQEATWRQLSKYIDPTRGYFCEDDGSEGQRKDYYLIDPYPMEAIGKCAAGLHSGLTSPSRPWFELSLQDTEKAEYHPVRQWLDDVRDILMDIYARSQTYAMLYNIEAEISQFGTAAALMLQDYDTAISHRSFTCGEYAGGVDAGGRVNAFARRFRLNARQMVTEYGRDNVSEAVRAAYDRSDLTSPFYVEMLIERNDSYEPEKLALGNFPWVSYYWERGQDRRLLRISGFHEQPFLMPRWQVVAGQVYGTGPGHKALGNCMQLQRIERQKLRAIDNQADPAMIFPASMKKANTMPGAKNYVPDGTQMTAYPIIPPNAKPYVGIMELVREKRDQIASAFYNDLLAMLSSQNNPQMTAREIAERHEEKMLLLGPVLEQFDNEVLKPLTLRTFGVCLRNKLLPPMPEEISAGELKVNFVSLLAQAQKSASMPSVEKLVGFIGGVAALYPEAADNLNIDKAVRKSAALTGTPEEILRSEEEMEQLRKQRAEAQAAAQQQAQLANAAAPAKDLAQAARLMSEVPANGDGTVLDELIGGGIG